MAGTLVVDTLKTSTTNPPVIQNTSGTEVGKFCRAWVDYNMSTSTLNASFNVSSVTKNTTGVFTINFSTAMPDTSYSVSGMCKDSDSSITSLLWLGLPGPGTGYDTVTTSAVTIACCYGPSSVLADSPKAGVSIFR